MRLMLVSAFAALLCASTAALAAGESAPAAGQSEDQQAEKPKKICRMETATGSVMPKRVCRTPEQVAADEDAARRTRDAMNRNRGM